jgi:hypothetical protein
MSDQTYRGNGEHTWEEVKFLNDVITDRLRVPGGWLYRVTMDPTFNDGLGGFNVVFVPMPEVVKHKV